ncbi:HNH endonuclease [Brucella pseudogrignonensis]|uniref:HNH endonuclease n=1 Tax=Brucella pseudogrignonensis TaxID=419475 RepID=UPI003ECEF9FC
MAAKPLPSPEVLRQLLNYDPETGKLFWKERGAEIIADERIRNSWNSAWAEKEAFTCIAPVGYRQGNLMMKRQYAHRVAWAIFYGEWPILHIDHINGDRTDNRIENLRQANRNNNQHNQGLRKSNTSGFKGVSWNRQCEKWAAWICVGGKQRYLGLHATAEDAHAAYCDAAKRFHGEFARTS